MLKPRYAKEPVNRRYLHVSIATAELSSRVFGLKLKLKKHSITTSIQHPRGSNKCPLCSYHSDQPGTICHLGLTYAICNNKYNTFSFLILVVHWNLKVAEEFLVFYLSNSSLSICYYSVYPDCSRLLSSKLVVYINDYYCFFLTN